MDGGRRADDRGARPAIDHYRRDDGSTLYVNRGLGRFERISFYCPPELTVWELVPSEDDRGNELDYQW